MLLLCLNITLSLSHTNAFSSVSMYFVDVNVTALPPPPLPSLPSSSMTTTFLPLFFLDSVFCHFGCCLFWLCDCVSVCLVRFSISNAIGALDVDLSPVFRIFMCLFHHLDFCCLFVCVRVLSFICCVSNGSEMLLFVFVYV